VYTAVSLNKKELQTIDEIAARLDMTRHGIIKSLIRKVVAMYEEGKINEIKQLLSD